MPDAEQGSVVPTLTRCSFTIRTVSCKIAQLSSQDCWEAVSWRVLSPPVLPCRTLPASMAKTHLSQGLSAICGLLGGGAAWPIATATCKG